MDLRGCGAGEQWAYKPPHAGLTTDLADVLKWIESHQQPAWLSLVGFSLGGNLVLKFLGELAQGKFADSKFGKNLRHAVAVGPPIDLNLAADSMERGVSRIYTAYFMRLLQAQLQRKFELWPQWRILRTNKKLATIREFDDAYTAPLSGFESAAEYYRVSSSKPFLADIEVPCDLLVAEDDPIVPVACFAGLRRGEAWLPKVGGIMKCTRYGGHLGYVRSGKLTGIREAGKADIESQRRWMDHWVFDSLQRAAGNDGVNVPKIALS
jgi:predicted alpha/beta-fold hydrolase